MSEILLQQNGKPEVTEFDNGRLRISIPIEIKRRSGRKRITVPICKSFCNNPDIELTPLQQALTRGFRWLQLLELGEATNLKAIAELEQVDNSYVSRMVNLTTLAPDIIAAILDNDLPENVTLFDLAVDPPVLWRKNT